MSVPVTTPPAVALSEPTAPPQTVAVPESTSIPAPATTPSPTPVLAHITAAAPPKSKNATLYLTTTPTGATFAIYPGVIAGKTAPSAAPLRSGESPNSIEDLPPGRYTLFLHNEGWADDRTEISVSAGESVPVDYTFPHGSAIITSTPDGAEIFFGTQSLGHTPLTVDLPLGKRHLVARYPDLSERTQIVTIESATPAKVAFQLRARSRTSKKPTPPPTALDKIGQSLKHVFGPKNPTPPPRKKH